MTTKQFQAEPYILDYTEPGSGAISAGDEIVLNGMIGVAVEGIAQSGTGPVAIGGVYRLTKVTGAVILAGDAVFWDASASNCDDEDATKATGDFTVGTAMEAAGAGVLTIAVKLSGSPQPVT